MSKPLNKKNVLQNKKDAISKLDKFLDKYINNPTEEHIKKADLISYWLKDYTRYIEFEERFDPKRYIAYKRGDVIKVNFGFNIGAEYGGLHYAVVLDNHNDHASPVVTVAPLTSTKENSKSNKHNVPIGNELYRLMKIKAEAAIRMSAEERSNIEKSKLYYNSLFKMVIDSIVKNKNSPLSNNKSDEDAVEMLELLKQTLDDLCIQLNHLDNTSAELKKILSEISRMKKGSTVLVGQITTVSKMRIYDPKKSKDVLYGISISKENMDKINDKIKELYVFKK